MITDISKLRVGDKVHYQPKHYGIDEWENGIIKEVPYFATNKDYFVVYNCIRVVYNCAGNWSNYMNYTSALTNIDDLYLGWRHQ